MPDRSMSREERFTLSHSLAQFNTVEKAGWIIDSKGLLHISVDKEAETANGDSFNPTGPTPAGLQPSGGPISQ